MYFYIYFTEMCSVRQLKHTDDSRSHSSSHIHFTLPPPSPPLYPTPSGMCVCQWFLKHPACSQFHATTTALCTGTANCC